MLYIVALNPPTSKAVIVILVNKYKGYVFFVIKELKDALLLQWLQVWKFSSIFYFQVESEC